MGQPIVLARRARDVGIAVVQLGHIAGEGVGPELAGDFARVPQHRIPLPDGRVDRLVVALGCGEAGMPVPARCFGIDENTGVIADHCQRQLEG
ncbi:hypothetical protein D9M68_951840 [compost metagenome]